jgi:hypothetical protein
VHIVTDGGIEFGQWESRRVAFLFIFGTGANDPCRGVGLKDVISTIGEEMV